MLSERKKEQNKIGILTLYHDNYNFGGLLQAYALPVALKKYLGINAEQIDYVFTPEKNDKNITNVSSQSIIYKLGVIFFNKLEKNNLSKRRNVFDQFIKEIPHSKECYEFDSISHVLNSYNSFICGGDQIWNDYTQLNWYGKNDSSVLTLRFVPDNMKKISYAPSMGVFTLTNEFRKEFGNWVNRLDAISVREKKILPELEKMTNKAITVVVDPVLLLTEKDWSNVMAYSPKKKKYILCYLLGDSIAQRKSVEKLARKVNCKIITFSHILGPAVRKCDLFFGDIHDYSSGPREFIGLIKNAEFVITDSFHACVFSMIFETPFVVFERNKIGEKGNMNSRIYDFLEEYHLENQLVTEKEMEDMKEIPRIDYTYAHAHWKKRREESLEYLENALKDN